MDDSVSRHIKCSELFKSSAKQWISSLFIMIYNEETREEAQHLHGNDASQSAREVVPRPRLLHFHFDWRDIGCLQHHLCRDLFRTRFKPYRFP